MSLQGPIFFGAFCIYPNAHFSVNAFFRSLMACHEATRAHFFRCILPLSEYAFIRRRCHAPVRLHLLFLRFYTHPFQKSSLRKKSRPMQLNLDVYALFLFANRLHTMRTSIFSVDKKNKRTKGSPIQPNIVI